MRVTMLKKKNHREKGQKGKSSKANSGYFWIMGLWVPFFLLLTFLYFTIFHNRHASLYNEEGKYLKPDHVLKAVKHCFSSALQRAPGLEHSGESTRASERAPRWENMAALRGHLGLMSLPSCSPFSLHLNFP